MSLTIQPPPTVASDLSCTYQFTLPFIAGVQESSATLPSSAVAVAFPSPALSPNLPCPDASPMPAQEPVLSFPLVDLFFDDSEHRMCFPTAPYAPTFPGSGYATAEGSHDQRWSGRRRSPLYSQRADYGWSDIGQPSSDQHADWYDQSSHCLSSTFQFTSVYCRRSGTVSYSTTICFAYVLLRLSFLPPDLPCTEATPMPAQEPVLSIPSPASLEALAEHFFDGADTVRALPLSPMSLPFLDRATLPPKESPSSPSTRPHHSTRPP